MSRLLISSRHSHAIHQHSVSLYPEECCGILIGRRIEHLDDGVIVERILCAQNARADRRRDRFLIEPKTLLAAHREARALGFDIVGYYHSHPDHPAKPSELDREHAWPGVSYVIVSVQGGRVENTRSWRLSDDRGQFDEEEIIDQELSPAHGSSPREARRA